MKRILLTTALIFSIIHAHSQWNNLGTGLNGTVKALTVFNGEIYAGGAFTNPAHIAKWSVAGNAWIPVGNGFNGEVNALAVHNGQLYAGGAFTADGSANTMNRIAVLSSGNWQMIGTSGLNGAVNALFSDGGLLYVGGLFNNSGSPTVSRIATWNGSAFSQVGDNPGNIVNAITKFNGTIHIGGNFIGYVKRFVSGSWQVIPGGTNLNNNVYALSAFGSNLFIGGAFSAPTSRIARFDGANISAAINTLNGTVHCLYSTPSKLFAGGAFTQSPSSTADLPHFLSYNGMSPFFTEGSDFNGDIFAIANFNGYIVVGGSFTSSGSSPMNRVAISSQTIDINELTSAIHNKVFYPNPVSEQAILKIESTRNLLKPLMKIYDSMGRLMFHITPEGTDQNMMTEFNFSRKGLAAGNYVYTVEEENGNILLRDVFIAD